MKSTTWYFQVLHMMQFHDQCWIENFFGTRVVVFHISKRSKCLIKKQIQPIDAWLLSRSKYIIFSSVCALYKLANGVECFSCCEQFAISKSCVHGFMWICGHCDYCFQTTNFMALRTRTWTNDGRILGVLEITSVAWGLWWCSYHNFQRKNASTWLLLSQNKRVYNGNASNFQPWKEVCRYMHWTTRLL